LDDGGGGGGGGSVQAQCGWKVQVSVAVAAPTSSARLMARREDIAGGNCTVRRGALTTLLLSLLVVAGLPQLWYKKPPSTGSYAYHRFHFSIPDGALIP
jgi:hypothetical protein